MKSITSSPHYAPFLASLTKLTGAVLRARVERAKEESTLEAYIELLIDLEKAHEDIEDANKNIKKEIEVLRQNTIPEKMDKQGGKTFTAKSGHRITVSTKFVGSVATGMKEKAFAWLRKRKAGSLITETISAPSLGVYAKQIMEEKGIELPSDLFNIHVLNVTSLTKAPVPKVKKTKK